MDINKKYYPTAVPDIILSIKGKVNARNGDEVVSSYVEKLVRRTEAYESQQCMTAESEIADERKTAAELLTDIAKQKQIIARLPAAENGNTVDVFRANRKTAETINLCKKTIENDLIVLSKIHEKIISIDADLNEVIIKAKKNCESKIAAYCVGVRKINSEYEPSINYKNDALKMYYSKHQMLDEEIKLAVKKFKEV